MKFKTTKKEMLASCKCYSIGYCRLQDMLHFTNPAAYTSGVYGWNADIYLFNNIALVTGYRPFGKSIPHDLTQKYEIAAEKTLYSMMPIDLKEKRLNSLIADFIGELKRLED